MKPTAAPRICCIFSTFSTLSVFFAPFALFLSKETNTIKYNLIHPLILYIVLLLISFSFLKRILPPLYTRQSALSVNLKVNIHHLFLLNIISQTIHFAK